MRRVFFSFDYDNDCWRAAQVRNSNITKASKGFIDAVNWEEIKKKGDSAIKNWIDEQMKGTSVTVVLIGAKTKHSKWVKHEIEKSITEGKGLLGIYIHQLKNQKGEDDCKGASPLKNNNIHYDWKDNKGYNNIQAWIEKAANRAGVLAHWR